MSPVLALAFTKNVARTVGFKHISKINEPTEVENDIGMNYIEIAEKIIAQEQVSRTTAKITLLEAIRHINKIKPDKNLSYYTSRLI